MRSLAGEVKKANKEVCNRPVRAIQFVEIELRPRSRMRDLRKLKLQYVGTRRQSNPVRLPLLEHCCTAPRHFGGHHSLVRTTSHG